MFGIRIVVTGRRHKLIRVKRGLFTIALLFPDGRVVATR